MVCPDVNLEYTLLETFEPGCIESGFGAQYLSRFCNQGSRLSEKELSRYTLEADLKLNGSNYGQRFPQKYFDATFNFCLAHDGELVATLGFEIDESAVMIWQIQGVKGKGALLEPFKWGRALVAYCVAWAERMAAEEIFIVSVDHNDWAAQHGHLDRSRGKLLYDVTAKRSGFRRTDDGYYRLSLLK